jgi:tetratricopeptide (TPR) repeat protein
VLLGGCTSAVETYRKQGVKLYQSEQYEQSMTAFDKALAANQFDAVSNAYAGLLHYRLGEYEQAEYHCRVALDRDPSSEEAKNGLTATLIKLGKPDEALDALERAAKMAEGVDDPREEKSFKRPYTKQVEERLFLGKVNDRVRIARAYQGLGDYDNALVYYKKALLLSPEDPNVLMAIADMYEKAGNKGQTQVYLKRAYRQNPAIPGITDAMTRNGVAVSEALEER